MIKINHVKIFSTDIFRIHVKMHALKSPSKSLPTNTFSGWRTEYFIFTLLMSYSGLHPYTHLEKQAAI